MENTEQKAVETGDLAAARELLVAGGYTCVLHRGGVTHTTRDRGVRPLVRWLTEGTGLKGFSAADKVVGKATAYLYVLLGVRAVYAGVISAGALEVLRGAGIEAEFDTLTRHIINRAGDGICPFEAAVADAQTPDQALTAIREKMEQMGIRV